MVGEMDVSGRRKLSGWGGQKWRECCLILCGITKFENIFLMISAVFLSKGNFCMNNNICCLNLEIEYKIQLYRPRVWHRVWQGLFSRVRQKKARVRQLPYPRG